MSDSSKKNRIEYIEIANYRMFRHAEFKNLQSMAVIVGVNGSGKSTFFDIFSFLKEALAHDVSTAIRKRGGFQELASRDRDQNSPIRISVSFRESGGRLATYALKNFLLL